MGSICAPPLPAHPVAAATAKQRMLKLWLQRRAEQALRYTWLRSMPVMDKWDAERSWPGGRGRGDIPGRPAGARA